jgi:hypothetical protein
MSLQTCTKQPIGFTIILLNLSLVTKTVHIRPNDLAYLVGHVTQYSLSAEQKGYLDVDLSVAGAIQADSLRKPLLINANIISTTGRSSAL